MTTSVVLPTTESLAQPGILAPVPILGRSLTFQLQPAGDVRLALKNLQRGFQPGRGVVGLGEPVSSWIGQKIPDLRPFPALAGSSCTVPSTQAALWISLQGTNRSELFDESERVAALLENGFVLDDALDMFKYGSGRDLTGYEDGTENPKDAEAVEASIVGTGALRGSSYVAVQRWVHDLRRFRAFPKTEQDLMVGRERDSNDEIEDAPATAHVKRSEQESFEPDVFMLRRSMPWATAHEKGLEFISYVENLDRFERVMRRMAGLEDGVVDALFTFSKPVTGGYYWCPPVVDDRIDLSLLSIKA